MCMGTLIGQQSMVSMGFGWLYFVLGGCREGEGALEKHKIPVV